MPQSPKYRGGRRWDARQLLHFLGATQFAIVIIAARMTILVIRINIIYA